MTLAVMYEWVVVINDTWKYEVTAPFCAEAQHEAVCKWRKDNNVGWGERSSRIVRMTTECLFEVGEAQVGAKPAAYRLAQGEVLVASRNKPQVQHRPRTSHQRQGPVRAMCGKPVEFVRLGTSGVPKDGLPMCSPCDRRHTAEAQ